MFTYSSNNIHRLYQLLGCGGIVVAGTTFVAIIRENRSFYPYRHQLNLLGDICG
mgnify:CR=1 FL=1